MQMQMGYRHFDTAKIYGSEPALGKAVREAISDGLVDREHIFVTSKLWSSDHHDPVSALHHSLQYVQNNQFYLTIPCKIFILKIYFLYIKKLFLNTGNFICWPTIYLIKLLWLFRYNNLFRIV